MNQPLLRCAGRDSNPDLLVRSYLRGVLQRENLPKLWVYQEILGIFRACPVNAVLERFFGRIAKKLRKDFIPCSPGILQAPVSAYPDTVPQHAPDP